LESLLCFQDEHDDQSIKLADFGFARKVTGENSLSTLCGTAQYVAPEILDFQVEGYDERCDMWSVGVVTYILLGGYAPFEGPPDELAQFIIRGDYEFHDKYWADISQPAKDMISAMLQTDPEQRMTAESALHCGWMAMDAEALASKDLSNTQTQMETTELSKAPTADTKVVKKAFQALLKTNKWLSLGAMAGNQTAPGGKFIEDLKEDDFEDCYDWGKQIGVGTFSVIHEARHRDSGETYAVKRIPRNDLWEEDAVALQDEVMCLKLVVDCPHIVKMKEVFDETDFTFMVLEPLRGGYLIDKIIEKENYNEPDGLEVATRLIKGLAFCHEKRIAVRDLKPESLLLVSAISCFLMFSLRFMSWYGI
jgi:serine/threonine protein kinase